MFLAFSPFLNFLHHTNLYKFLNEIVDSVGNVGLCNSLALDVAGNLILATLTMEDCINELLHQAEDPHYDLKYAYYCPSSRGQDDVEKDLQFKKIEGKYDGVLSDDQLSIHIKEKISKKKYRYRNRIGLNFVRNYNSPMKIYHHYFYLP